MLFAIAINRITHLGSSINRIITSNVFLLFGLLFVILFTKVISFDDLNSYRCYLQEFGYVGSKMAYWERVQVGKYSTPTRPCLSPNGLPVRRKCIYKTKVGPILDGPAVSPSDCMNNITQKLITDSLADLREELYNATTTDVIRIAKKLKTSLRKGDYKLIPADVFITAKVVENAIDRIKTRELCLELMSINTWFMKADTEILRASAVLNSTNSLLANFETCIDSTIDESDSVRVESMQDKIESLTISELGVRTHLSESLSVIYIDPRVANVLGVAIYNQVGTRHKHNMYRKAFSDFYYRFIFPNETLDNLLDENGLQLASFVPMDVWMNITQSLSHRPLLVIKIYSNDALFMESRLNTTRKAFSKVLSLTIPGVTGSFNRSIPIVFRNHYTGKSHQHPQTGCGYWNYDSWVSDGMELIRNNYAKNNLIACGAHHMTQYAYLIGGDYRYNDFSNNVVITKLNFRALNIITLVGNILSMIGLFGIYITFMVFKSWRSRSSSQVLIHLSTAILLQMILFCFVNTHQTSMEMVANNENVACIALGSLLQYSVLVQFTWMLIIAFFQFQRYVQVFGTRPDYFILKSAIFAWGLPLIPPAILVGVDRGSYIPSPEKDGSWLCYPSGAGLHFGVMLPIALIITANLVIFVMVLWSIRHTMKVASKRNQIREILQQIRLMAMMFFLFGFSWIFGLLAAMNAGLVFSYLFCITATLQGFMLFIYFVVMDPTTRKLWFELYWDPQIKRRETEISNLTTRSGD